MNKTKKPIKKLLLEAWTIQRAMPFILIITAVVGLIASLVLSLEHIALLKDPNHQLSCSVNPIINCGPIMTSEQATAFGFPNPLIGIGVFSAQLLLGLAMLAGARMKSWFWKLYALSIAGGIAFTLWLMYESIFEIGTLCIYCVSVWIANFIAGWYLFQYMLAENHVDLKNKKLASWLRKHHGDILIAWFLLIIGLILHEFWYYYGPKLGF